jgi:quercetin 2,3-dioxygenase
MRIETLHGAHRTSLEAQMPAVTVPTVLTLPRIAGPEPAASVDRAVRGISTAPRGYEGEGFPVAARSPVSICGTSTLLHMDQMGEVDYAPGEPKGTPWHPHRGFKTVTYMIDGQMQHADSHGGGV